MLCRSCGRCAESCGTRCLACDASVSICTACYGYSLIQCRCSLPNDVIALLCMCALSYAMRFFVSHFVICEILDGVLSEKGYVLYFVVRIDFRRTRRYTASALCYVLFSVEYNPPQKYVHMCNSSVMRCVVRKFLWCAALFCMLCCV